MRAPQLDEFGRPVEAPIYDQWGNVVENPDELGTYQGYGPPQAPVATPDESESTFDGSDYLQPTPVVPPPNPNPTTPVNPGSGWGTGAGDLTAPFTGTAPTPSFAPLPQTPVFRAPPYERPPAFSFGEFERPAAFQSPDAERVLADPGYQFRRDQANQAFMNNRAASQTAHTGGTLKDFLGYNQDMASQEYGNVWNRDYNAYRTNFDTALSSYATNRANALGNYNTNYQTQYQDPWNIADESAQQEFAPQMAGYATNAADVQHQNDVRNNSVWNSYLQDFNIFRDQRDSTFNKRFAVASA